MSRINDGSPGTAQASPERRVPLGLIVGICVLILSCAGAVIYAGSSAAEVAYRLIVEGSIVLLWLVSAAGWGAWPTVWLLRATSDKGKTCHLDPLIRVVTAIAIGLGAMGLAILGLGLAGLLSRVVGFVLLGSGALSAIVWGLRFYPRFMSASSRYGHRATWLWLAVIPTTSLALAAAFVPPGLLWKPHEPHGYDVVEYHFQIPREWYDAGRIQPTPHNTFGYFPFGSEMHDLLAFHLSGGAWNGMYLAQLMHVATMALAVIAMCGFANQIARSPRVAVIASVLGATIPWLTQLAPIGFNEGALLLYATLAIGWTLIAISRTTLEGRGLSVRLLTLAGLSAGFACGVKLTAIPLVLIAVPVVATLVVLVSGPVRRVPLRDAVRSVLPALVLFVTVALIVLAPWLIRNIARTGNPVFPEGRAFFGNGTFSELQTSRWSAAHTARPDQRSVAGRLAAFVDEVVLSSQFGYLLLPLAIVALVLNRRDLVSWFLGGLLLIQVGFWLGFTHLQGRFFVLAIPVAVLAIAAAPWERLVRYSRRPEGNGCDAIRGRSPVIAVAVVMVVALSARNWYFVHDPFARKLYEEQGTGIVVTMGKEDISWITSASMEGFPLDDASAKLVLVGDAQAFWYPLPSSRLYYRTVFDLDTQPNRSLLDAFDPLGWRHDGRTWLLIAPAELERYEKTYQPFPSIPASWKQSADWERGIPFLVRPEHIKKY